LYQLENVFQGNLLTENPLGEENLVLLDKISKKEAELEYINEKYLNLEK
jgi:hypothetical protein